MLTDSTQTTARTAVCPRCLRAVRTGDEHCPWDGASLAGGSAPEGSATDTTTALAQLLGRRRVPVPALRQLAPVTVADYASVGGGVGSFVWADALRLGGVPAERIVSLGAHAEPLHHYRLLAERSRISPTGRLRSGSESCPDNLWGWPGYALREAGTELRRGRVDRALRVAWQILGEPSLAETYTPRLEDVVRAVDREAERIGWPAMVRPARVQRVRQTDDGRFAVVFEPIPPRRSSTRTGNSGVQRAVLVTRHLHLAMGYPGLRILEDVQRWRAETGDLDRVVNAYEAHDHVYEHLRAGGGTVLLRGRGIVASRVLERLAEEQRRGRGVRVVHLLRGPTPAGRDGRARRAGAHHFAFQPFNWPRGAWGGTQRERLARADPEERVRLLRSWGGTTTARRRLWTRLVAEGLRDGWYEQRVGRVQSFRPQGGRPAALLMIEDGVGSSPNSEPAAEALVFDYVIDATGLDLSLDADPVLGDLVRHYRLPRNPLGGLDVDTDFEVAGLGNGPGRAFAAGVATFGGPYAGVDTFLGLQYAALRSVDVLAALPRHGPNLTQPRRLNGVHSLRQWARWVRGVAP